jgi:hypothetical protein
LLANLAGCCATEKNFREQGSLLQTEIFMMTRLRKFVALDSESRRLFLQAYYLLGAMRFALLTSSFKRLVSGLSMHRSIVEQMPLEDGKLATAHRVGWAVCTAVRFTPWNSTCLVQVLAAQRMLQRRGIGGAFYLGASSGEEGGERRPLMAHAWLKCDDEFITGESGHERYTVVSSFTWL